MPEAVLTVVIHFQINLKDVGNSADIKEEAGEKGAAIGKRRLKTPTATTAKANFFPADTS